MDATYSVLNSAGTEIRSASRNKYQKWMKKIKNAFCVDSEPCGEINVRPHLGIAKRYITINGVNGSFFRNNLVYLQSNISRDMNGAM